MKLKLLVYAATLAALCFPRCSAIDVGKEEGASSSRHMLRREERTLEELSVDVDDEEGMKPEPAAAVEEGCNELTQQMCDKGSYDVSFCTQLNCIVPTPHPTNNEFDAAGPAPAVFKSCVNTDGTVKLEEEHLPCTCGTHAICGGRANGGNRFCYEQDFDGKGLCFDREACPDKDTVTRKECKCGKSYGLYKDVDSQVMRCKALKKCAETKCIHVNNCTTHDGKTAADKACVCGMSSNIDENDVCVPGVNEFCFITKHSGGFCRALAIDEDSNVVPTTR